MNRKNRTDYEEFAAASAENRRLLRQEELMLEATDGLAILMHRQGLSKADLARRLGRTRGYITQILSGGRNFTLRTLAEVADALGHRVRLTFDSDTALGAAASPNLHARPAPPHEERAARGRGQQSGNP